MTNIKTIENHIANDDMSGALKETLVLFEDNRKLYEKVLELSGKHSQLTKQFRMGLFTGADEIKLRKEMRKELIDLLKEFNN